MIAATSRIEGTATGFGAVTSPLHYLSIQGLAILHYLRLIALPWGFTIDADPAIPALAWRLAAWIALAAAAIFAVRWFPTLGVGFWLLGSLLLLAPSSSIFRSMITSPNAACICDDRPRSGIGARRPASRSARHRHVLLLWTAVSIRYCWIWQSEQRLWSEAVALAPRKVRPRIQLARAAELRLRRWQSWPRPSRSPPGTRPWHRNKEECCWPPDVPPRPWRHSAGR